MQPSTTPYKKQRRVRPSDRTMDVIDLYFDKRPLKNFGSRYNKRMIEKYSKFCKEYYGLKPKPKKGRKKRYRGNQRFIDAEGNLHDKKTGWSVGYNSKFNMIRPIPWQSEQEGGKQSNLLLSSASEQQSQVDKLGCLQDQEQLEQQIEEDAMDADQQIMMGFYDDIHQYHPQEDQQFV